MSDGWADILDPNETIQWQGRPSGRFRIERHQIPLLLFGCAFAGFALVWMGLAAAAGGFFWTFGLIHFSVGVGLGIFPIFKDRFVRQRTWYTLSNKRAYIATDLPVVGKSLKTYPIESRTPTEFRPGATPSVFFSSKTVRRNKRRVEVPVGFEMIADGKEVHRLIQQIQTGTIPDAKS